MPRLAALVEQRLVTNKDVVTELERFNITTVEEILFVSPEAVAEMTKISQERLQRLIDEVQFCFASPVLRGDQLLAENRPFSAPLSTGCGKIDHILEGGMFSGEILELVGPSGSGKTQLCLQIAVSCAAAGLKVAYMDSGASLSSTRIAEICAANKFDESCLALIHVFEAESLDKLLSLLHEIASDDLNSTLVSTPLTGDFGDNFRVVIVDAFGSLVAPTLGGAFFLGHSMMTSCTAVLRQIAWKLHAAIVVTNHAVGERDGPLKPALGESWSFEPAVSLWLQNKSLAVVDRAGFASSSERRSGCRAVLRKSNKTARGAMIDLVIGKSGFE